MHLLRSLAACITLAALLISCQNESNDDSFVNQEELKSLAKENQTTEIEVNPKLLSEHRTSVLSFDLNKAVEETPCSDTEFFQSIDDEVDAILTDPYFLGPFGLWFSLYADVNFIFSLFDDGPQTFGDDGQYTNYVQNRTRNLEKFWNMPDEIDVKGQHRSTLEDRDKIIFTLTSPGYGYPEDFAGFVADQMLLNNELSEVIPETPLVAADGFAISLNGLFGLNDIIVIGDGLVELFEVTGVEDKIVWSGILAHEWAHHIQTNNNWFSFWDGAFDNEPERTRAAELEADFFASYYLTHKRGATYNWKRVEQFLETFFQIGDCSFTSGGHHGTPDQRMEASRLGYELAASAKVKGKILTEEEVHELFVEVLDDIVAVP